MPLFIRNGERRKLYKEEYAKQKELAKQEQRARMLEQTKKAAKTRAYSRYNVTPVERRQQRIKKIQGVRNRMQQMNQSMGNRSRGLDFDFGFGGPSLTKSRRSKLKHKKHRIKSSKRKVKKPKSIWDMTINDI